MNWRRLLELGFSAPILSVDMRLLLSATGKGPLLTSQSSFSRGMDSTSQCLRLPPLSN
jgi:hypothetical protein